MSTTRHRLCGIPLVLLLAPGVAAQPDAAEVNDTLRYLVQAPSIADSMRREVQIDGPDVLSYSETLDRTALVLGLRPRRRIPVPLITPRLSSL